jgi:hypothetical protein
MAWVRIPAVLEESESAQGVGGNPSVRVSSGGVSAMLCSATEELAEGLNGAPTANRGTNRGIDRGSDGETDRNWTRAQ